MEQKEASDHKRRDLVIILIILLIGFLCVIVAGEQAARFAPRWKMDASMGSNIDPNSDFLTSRPVNFIEPLNASILTQPAWINVFLTPGAFFETQIPALLTNTPIRTDTPVPTLFNSPTAINPTNTLVVIAPTNTLIFYPPPPTKTLKPPPTTIPPPTTVPVDLQITKTDNATTYISGTTVTYTIVVTNGGPNNVTGTTVSDPKPAQVTTWGWCIAPCTPVASSSTGLSDTRNLTFGASVTYTVLANINAGATGDLVNTASVSVPFGYADTNTGNNSATDTDTLAASADLSITITDHSTDYIADAWKIYEIVVSNVGPSDVSNAAVSNNFQNGNTVTSSVYWACIPSAGASCAPIGAGILNNESVNLNSGSAVTFYLTAQVVSSPSGPLENAARVDYPADPNTGNNSATDADNLIVSSGTNYGNIGTGYSGPPIERLLGGESIILTLSSQIVVNGSHAGPDIIYYEESYGIGIAMDWVILEVSDGSNWYTVLNWGDGSNNPGTNITLPLPVPPNPMECNNEPDDCAIDASLLGINGTGITIDLDVISPSIIPVGTTVSYIRITVPPGGTDGGVGIDGIYVVP